MEKSGKMSYNEAASLFLVFLFLAGVLLGTLLYLGFGVEGADKLGRLSGVFLSGRLEQNFWQTLVNSFSGSFIPLLVCFLLGFGAVFQPVELFMPIFRGMGLGLSLAGMYGQHGIAGAGIALILFVPGGVISALTLIIAAREALRMSNSVCRIVFSRKTGFEPVDYKLYFAKFIVLSAILTAAAALDGLLTLLFAGFCGNLLK